MYDTAPRAFVVDERPNPSTDFFVLPALRASGAKVVRCGFDCLPSSEALDGAVVLFVRYVPKQWLRLVESVRHRLQKLVFFMDDDVLDVRASVGLPWRYRYKLARLSSFRRGWLQKQRAELWVSTPYLQQKYGSWRPKLVLPLPVYEATVGCRVFYHGTASHWAEIKWLYPIVEELLRAEESMSFEIVGGKRVYGLYRNLPRVTVVHPMQWHAYQAFLATPGRDIGLAPFLNTAFNRGRSCTKFFDITHCGAVGVYSSNSLCADMVQDGVTGRLVGGDPDEWVRAVQALAHDPDLRSAMYVKSLEQLQRLAAG
ncbi:MAG TPA: glycosyltransferase family 1 protein [Halothiobacillaceae bacterium]|nr:glycosyltransferase family 1 protein [Halothiobacillaceae bacterium]